jgi:hypothetical protein
VKTPANATWLDFYTAWKNGTPGPGIVGASSVKSAQPITSPIFPGYDLGIPEQVRANLFLQVFHAFEQNHDLPNLIVMLLPDDHTVGTSPGFPTPRATVADNDLAVGRIVDAVSHSSYWPKTAIFVIEDDAQSGPDHVDGHRTVALAVGPHIRRNVVDSNHYTHASMIRTIQEIFQIPARTRFLQNARAMTSIFTPRPDLKPYRKLTPQVALDEMNPPLKALRGKKLLAARQSAAINWSDLDDTPEKVLNQILWWDRKGYDKPYPKP